MDKAELNRQIASYSHRGDLAAELEGFIEAAYANLNSVLRLREQEKTVTLTAVNGTLTLPSDYQEGRSLTRAAGGDGGQRWDLPGVSQTELGGYGTGDEAWVHYLAGATIEVPPGNEGDFRLEYFAMIPVPTTGTATDVYLTRYPAMTLDACLERLGVWTQDLAMEKTRGAQWRGAAAQANAEAQRARFSSKPRATRPYRRARPACAT